MSYVFILSENLSSKSSITYFHAVYFKKKHSGIFNVIIFNKKILWQNI